ncbi:hypothetical protein MMC12_007273 [Toensbergia leucococca]|nr:hypothetical protein [Toensbergia leucococca]
MAWARSILGRQTPVKAQMKRTSDMLAYETSLTTASHNKSITIKSEKVAGAATNPDEQAELTQPSRLCVILV